MLSLGIIVIVVLVIILLFYLVRWKRREKEMKKELDDITRMIFDIKERLHEVRYKRPMDVKIDLEEKRRI